MPKYIAAIDQGTTSTRCILFDHAGSIISVDQCEHRQIYPQPGWVEHDALEIWENTQQVMQSAVARSGADVKDIAAIGITNQRETTIVWDRQTGEPIHNAIVWQDRRTAARCAELKEVGAGSLVRERTGLVIDPYFSGTKIAWLLDNVPGARARAERRLVRRPSGISGSFLARCFSLTGALPPAHPEIVPDKLPSNLAKAPKY